MEDRMKKRNAPQKPKANRKKTTARKTAGRATFSGEGRGGELVGKTEGKDAVSLCLSGEQAQALRRLLVMQRTAWLEASEATDPCFQEEKNDGEWEQNKEMMELFTEEDLACLFPLLKRLEKVAKNAPKSAHSAAISGAFSAP